MLEHLRIAFRIDDFPAPVAGSDVLSIRRIQTSLRSLLLSWNIDKDMGDVGELEVDVSEGVSKRVGSSK